MVTRFSRAVKRLYLERQPDGDVEAFAQVFREPVGTKVLEVGCNEEPVANILSFLCYNVVGADCRKYKVEKGKGVPLPLNYRFVWADFMRHVWDETFDVVVSLSTLEHFGFGTYGEERMEDGDLVGMSNIRGVLRPGGRAYIAVPVGQSENNGEWRVYGERDLERLIMGFTIEKQFFFLSDHILRPAMRSVFGKNCTITEGSPRYQRIMAEYDDPYLPVGSRVPRKVAFANRGPHVTTMMVLRRS